MGIKQDIKDEREFAMMELRKADRLVSSAQRRKDKAKLWIHNLDQSLEELAKIEFEKNRKEKKNLREILHPEKPTKSSLAASIEKVFGTQGLELVQRALREEGPGREQFR